MAYNYWQKSKSKYGNKKIEYLGQTFDSKKELNRWCELQLLERGGAIYDLKRQVPFELIPNQYKTVEKVLKSGKVKQEQKLVERKCEYIADFVYKNDKGEIVVEDTKGFRTPEYIIKRKLILYKYGIEIVEI